MMWGLHIPADSTFPFEVGAHQAVHDESYLYIANDEYEWSLGDVHELETWPAIAKGIAAHFHCDHRLLLERVQALADTDSDIKEFVRQLGDDPHENYKARRRFWDLARTDTSVSGVYAAMRSCLTEAESTLRRKLRRKDVEYAEMIAAKTLANTGGAL